MNDVKKVDEKLSNPDDIEEVALKANEAIETIQKDMQSTMDEVIKEPGKEFREYVKKSTEHLKDQPVEEPEERGGSLIFYFGIRAFFIAMIIVASFLGGGVYACEAGGGTFSGLQCVDVDVVGVCEWEGEYIKIGNAAVRDQFPLDGS